jgi:hypothetical protein
MLVALPARPDQAQPPRYKSSGAHDLGVARAAISLVRLRTVNMRNGDRRAFSAPTAQSRSDANPDSASSDHIQEACFELFANSNLVTDSARISGCGR